MFQNEESHAWYVGTREQLLATIKKHVQKEAKILDVGCGTGGTLKFLKSSGFKNAFGIDKSKIAISYCKKRGIKNVKLGNINKLDFNANTFDLVICLDVLYHKGVDLDKSIDEIRRVLKKNGILYSQEPAYQSLSSKHDVAIDTERRFNKRMLESLFAKGMFKKIFITHFNATLLLPIAISRYLDKLRHQQQPDSDVKKLPMVLNKIMLLLLRMERKSLDRVSFPFGLSIVSVWKK